MPKKCGLRFPLLAFSIICLISSCSKYDERSALVPALYIEKDNRAIVFTIVKYGKTVSYRTDGGSTYKQLNTNYFVQSNDAVTGELIANKKIMHSSKVKFHPVTTLGNGNGKAWLFMNGLMAFDPLTLDLFADKEKIESKNPALKGYLPDEERYYSYDHRLHEILITASNGISYSLSTATLLATAIDEDKKTVAPDGIPAELEKRMAKLDESYKTHHDRFRTINRLYSEKKISRSAYLDSSSIINQLQDSIRQKRQFIQEEMAEFRNLSYADRDRQRLIENLNRVSVSYSIICSAVDSIGGKWYGLLSSADLEKPEGDFRYRTVGNETARNKLYAGLLVPKTAAKASGFIAGEPEKINDAVYLQGGFLLDKTNALPIRVLNQAGFVICYREKVGSKGNIILSLVDLQGKAIWTYNTMLTEFADWTYTGKRLIILGNDNKEISYSEANLLISINMQNGQAAVHDYFTNAMRR